MFASIKTLWVFEWIWIFPIHPFIVMNNDAPNIRRFAWIMFERWWRQNAKSARGKSYLLTHEHSHERHIECDVNCVLYSNAWNGFSSGEICSRLICWHRLSIWWMDVMAFLIKLCSIFSVVAYLPPFCYYSSLRRARTILCCPLKLNDTSNFVDAKTLLPKLYARNC